MSVRRQQGKQYSSFWVSQSPMEGSRHLLGRVEVAVEHSAAVVTGIRGRLHGVDPGRTAGEADTSDVPLGRNDFADAEARFFRIAVEQTEGCCLALLKRLQVQQSLQLEPALRVLGHNLVEDTALAGMAGALGMVATGPQMGQDTGGGECEVGTFQGEDHA